MAGLETTPTNCPQLVSLLHVLWSPFSVFEVSSMQSLRTIRPTTAPIYIRAPRTKDSNTRPGRALPHSRANVDSIRSISSTSSASKVTHSLNTLRSTAQEIRYHNDARPGRQLRMVMFGKPGAGKGTLSTRLVKKYDITTLSTGDLLRMHIQERFVVVATSSTMI